MGGKTYLKPTLLVLILILSLLFLSGFAYAKCCVTQNNLCLPIPSSVTDSECTDENSLSGEIWDSDCNLYNDCNLGCCCGLANQYTTKRDCTANSKILEREGEAGLSGGICDQMCSGADYISPCVNNTCNGPNANACSCGGVPVNPLGLTPQSSYCCSQKDPVFIGDKDACISTCSLNTYTISGFVSDQTTGEKLSDVKITDLSSSHFTFSNSDGSYVLPYIPVGKGTISAKRLNYQNATITYELIDEDINISIFLINMSLASSKTCFYKNEYDAEAKINLCKDNIDNDCDGFSDCSDTDCNIICAKNILTTCGDGIVQTPNNVGINETCESDSGCSHIPDAKCIGCKCIRTISSNRCGDGIITVNEQCDPALPTTCSATQTCDYNCICVNKISKCGNVVIDEALGEECEFTDTLFSAVLPGSSCGLGQCIKPGFAGACQCRTDTLCGNFAIDSGEECDIGNSLNCDGKSCVMSTCRCEVCSEENKRPNLLNSTVGSSILLSWTIPCDSFTPQNYIIRRCEINSTRNTCVPTISYQLFTGSTLSSTVEDGSFCYDVAAVHLGNEYISDPVCLKKPVFECEDNPLDYFCENNKVTACESGNKVVKDDCSSSEDEFQTFVCIDFPNSNSQNAECISQSSCELCNGWFSMFSSKETYIQGVGIDNVQSNNILCSNLRTCYLDYTNTSVDKYYSCNNVDNCYDYMSEYACEENRCFVGNNLCEWVSSERFGELGVGVCRPGEEEKQDCRNCNYKSSYNQFFGACDEDLCSLYGKDCYYIDPDDKITSRPVDSPKGCVNKWQMACDYYSEKDCTRGVNSVVNTSWYYSGVSQTPSYPVSGSNIHTLKSADPLNFTYCRWVGNNNINKCFKDGNGDNSSDCADDWNQNLLCRKDFTPPRSTVIYVEPLKRDVSMRFGVFDKESNNSEKYFHFNIFPNTGVTCYPNGAKSSDKVITLNETTESGIIKYDIVSEFGENNTGKYVFCYFAEDAHDNYEIVRNLTIIIDSKRPEVTWALKNYSYESHVSPYGDEDYIFATDVNITASLDPTENATCSLWLSKQSSVQAGEIVVGNLSLLNRKGSNFSMNFKALSDGVYAFHTYCVDTAGNNNTITDYYFTLNADKKITDISQLPTLGPKDEMNDKTIEIKFSAKTTENAECRYTINPDLLLSADGFASMTPFSTTGGVVHSNILYYNNNNFADGFFYGPGIKKVYLRCNGTKGKVFGNDGDVITFAIDYYSPSTSFADNLDNPIVLNDFKWYRRHDLQNVYLKCHDLEMRYGGDANNPDISSGCSRINYSFSSSGASIAANANKTKIEFPLGNNIFNIKYYGTDKSGNNEDMNGPKLIKIDDEQYSFNFTIYDLPYRKKVSQITWGRTYEVVIKSSKNAKRYDPLYTLNLQDAGFYINGVNYSFSNISKDTYLEEKTNGVQSFVAYIKIGKMPSGTGEFFISAIDSHDIPSVTISNGKNFAINTAELQKPLITPSFDEGPDDFEYYYPTIFHHFGTETVYYTNDKNLFVTGSSDNQGIIYFYLNELMIPFTSYDMSQNADNKSINNYPVSVDIAKGSDTLIFSGNVLSDYKINNYIMISDKERANYTHYREYYKITNAELISSGGVSPVSTSKITISPSLEKNLVQGEKVYIYNKAYPSDWFSVNLNLSLGENTFYTRIINSVGNNKESNQYTLFFDNSTPSISGVIPSDGTKSGDNKSSVIITLFDVGSGIDLSGTKIKINNQEVRFTVNKSEIQDGNLMRYSYILNYTPPQGFEKGNYEVLFETIDMSRNKASKNWSFYIDNSLPRTPEFSFVGLNKEENYAPELNTWFTNQVRNFLLNFSDNILINISNVNIFKITNGACDSNYRDLLATNSASCLRSGGSNLFNCAFKDASLVADDSDYVLKIYAEKSLDSETKQGEYYKCFTIDTIPPEYQLEYKKRIRSNLNMTFKAVVDNPEKKLMGFIKFDNENKLELIPENGSLIDTSTSSYYYNQPFNFKFEVPEKQSKEYDFTFSLKDMAGNENNSRHKITIDNKPSLIVISNIITSSLYISPESDGLIVEEIDSLEKAKEIHEKKNNPRFRGDAISIIGDISADTSSVRITKMTKDGEFYNEEMPLILLNSCKSKLNDGQGCFESGKFFISNYTLVSLYGKEIPYYLLFNVTDEAENTAYYNLVIISDKKAPGEPDINIKE